MKINIDGNILEQVKQYCNLGSIITYDCTRHAEIKRRIAIGINAFAKKKELLRGKMNVVLKKRIVKCFIWSVALYGLETWKLFQEDKNGQQAFEM